MYQSRSHGSSNNADRGQRDGTDAELDPQLARQVEEVVARGKPRRVNDLLSLHKDRRAEILAYLQRTRGNAYVDEVLASKPQMSPAEEEARERMARNEKAKAEEKAKQSAPTEVAPTPDEEEKAPSAPGENPALDELRARDAKAKEELAAISAEPAPAPAVAEAPRAPNPYMAQLLAKRAAQDAESARLAAVIRGEDPPPLAPELQAALGAPLVIARPKVSVDDPRTQGTGEENIFYANQAGFAAHKEKKQAEEAERQARYDRELAAARERAAADASVATPAPAPEPVIVEPEAAPAEVAASLAVTASPALAPELAQEPVMDDKDTDYDIKSACRRNKPKVIGNYMRMLKGKDREQAIAYVEWKMGKSWLAEAIALAAPKTPEQEYLEREARSKEKAAADPMLQKALARKAGASADEVKAEAAPEAEAAPTAAPEAVSALPPAVAVEVQHEHITAAVEAKGVDPVEAPRVAAEVQVDLAVAKEPEKAKEITAAAAEVAAAPPEAAVEQKEDPRVAALDATSETVPAIDRVVARHQEPEKVEPAAEQNVEQAPQTPEARGEEIAEAAKGPVVQDAVTAAPPEAVVAPNPSGLTLGEVMSEAQSQAPASTAQQGIDMLNVEGSYETRMGRAGNIRADMANGTDTHTIDVQDDVRALMRQNIQGITDEQIVAIEGYTSEDYKHLNSVMRNPDANPERAAALKGYCDAISAGLQALPSHEGEVYRGTHMSQRLFDSWVTAHAEGRAVADAAYSSSSRDEGVAGDFLKNTKEDGKVGVFCKIQSRTGKQVSFLSRTANELEVLFDAKTKFRIVYIVDTVVNGVPCKEVMLVEVGDEWGNG